MIRRRSKARVTHVNGRAPGAREMGEGRTAVVLEWAEHGIGVDLITRCGEEAATVIIAQIVPQRGNQSGRADNRPA